MDFDPQDQDIAKLLAKLKNAEGEYPEHMFVARRHMYLKQMAEIGMGMSVDKGVEHAAKTTNPPALPPAASTLLETVLLIAIIAETSAVAYFYRDKLADFFRARTTDARVQEVTSPPVVTTAAEIQGATASPALSATIPPGAILSASPTDFIVPVTGTPIPGVADEPGNGATSSSITNNSTNIDSGGTGNQADSTPVPDANDPDNGNNGNHYGQTPKPERTKENNGNNDPSPPDTNNDPLPPDTNSGPPDTNNNPHPGGGNNRPP